MAFERQQFIGRVDALSDVVLVDVDDSDRDDTLIDFKRSEVAASDRTKAKRLQHGHIKCFVDGSMVASVPAAAASLTRIAKPEKFVVKDTQQLLTLDELWRSGINRDAVEPLKVAAERARNELCALIKATGTRRAGVASSLARTEAAAKELRQMHGATTSAIEARLSAVQMSVEKHLDEVRAFVVDSVRLKKQALLAAADSTLAERRAMLEALRAELAAVEAEHAKAEAACTDDLAKEDEAVICTPKQVATPYSCSVEPVTYAGMVFEFSGPGTDELVGAAAEQITDAVAGCLSRFRVSTDPCAGGVNSAPQSSNVGMRRLHPAIASGQKEAKHETRGATVKRTAALTAPECTGHRQHGVFFDLVNTSGLDLEIVELELCSKSSVPVTQRLYTRTAEEGCGGTEKSPGVWREVGSAWVRDQDTPGLLRLSKPEIISAGTVRGFHLHCPDSCFAVALSHNKGAVEDGTLRVEPMGYTNYSAPWQGATSAVPPFGPCGKFTYTQHRTV